MVWLLLATAIASEVTATISLRFSEGFTKLAPSIIVVLGYGLSFWLFGQVLKHGMSVGVAYGIWCGVGMSLVALVGVVLLKEPLTWTQIGGLVLVIAGIVALQPGITQR